MTKVEITYHMHRGSDSGESLIILPMTEEQIDQMLTDYFRTNETITRRQFQILCTQVKSTAHRILQKLVENGKLRNVSTKQNPVYMPGNGHYKSVADN